MESDCRRKELPAAEALKNAQIRPLVPQGKDGLGILSNNSIGMALTMNAVKTLRQVVKVTPTVFGLTLEGMNGNVAPFLVQSVSSHPLPGLQEAAQDFRAALKGSYLWDKTPSAIYRILSASALLSIPTQKHSNP